jgi:hypothetical protein
MPSRSARSVRGGGKTVVRWFIRAAALAALISALVLPRVSAAAPTPRNVLLVANGYYTQENDLEDHFLDLGYSVTRMKDYKLTSTTNLAAYDLLVITEFAPSIPTSGITKIKSSGKPVLIVEYWDFSYAYKLGLTTSASCGYVGTDTITAIREGYDDFTSRVGAEALVYQPQYTVYGIALSKVKSNATPLYWSKASFGEVAMLVDYTKKIAVTGVYDTRKYTVDAWKMLDVLTAQILPEPARYGSLDELAQAYVDSGLYDFILNVQSDLKANPQSWTFTAAEEEAWLLTAEWHLDELWDNTLERLYDAFGTSPAFPGVELYFPPGRPHGDPNLHPSYLPDSLSTEYEYWFMGGYWYPGTNTVTNDSFKWSHYLSGTDLGMSAELHGRRYFYMGDTWDPKNRDPQWSTVACPSPAKCDDLILVSQDNDPINGITASPILFSKADKWMPIVIPGVHKDFSPVLHTAAMPYWDGSDNGAGFTAPSGIATTMMRPSASYNGASINIPVRGVMLWYGTATAPYGLDAAEPLDSSNSRHRPMSWVGCSTNGIFFHACYKDVAGDVVPFSADVSPLGRPIPPYFPPVGAPCELPGNPARFIHVAGIELDEGDFIEVCDEDPSGPMCGLYGAGATNRQGLLLYGSGRPYRKSGLFLAFIKSEEIGQVDASGKPIVHYWTGDSDAPWSFDEWDALSLTDTPPCDRWREPDYYDATTQTGGCWPKEDPPGSDQYDWYPKQVFGELSARLIRSNDPNVSSQIVLMNNSVVVLSWKAPLSAPWGGDFASLSPSYQKTYGYGPYIIDGLGDTTYPGSGPNGDIVLWHTISVWQGDNPPTRTPYGVYTGSEVISWQ